MFFIKTNASAFALDNLIIFVIKTQRLKQFFFLHKKIKFLSRKWKLVRPIASPSMVVWSMLACHISSMLTLEYHNSVRVCFLRCRDISSSTGRLSEM